MTVNFQNVRDKVRQMGESALQREKDLNERRKQARDILNSYQNEASTLQHKVQETLQYDRTLRCAKPDELPLTLRSAAPGLQQSITLIAADGSQINFDRHAEVQYALINVGAIIARSDSTEAPKTVNRSELFFDDQLYTPTGMINESDLALSRDLGERAFIAKLAENCLPPIVSLTDGPLELWGARDGGEAQAADYHSKLTHYKKILLHLEELGVIPGGYVDNPGANLVVRLLELTLASPQERMEIKSFHPLRGVTDSDLFKQILQPGERSAVFTIQSISSNAYKDQLGMEFFYLNVGQPGNPWMARVEIPAWVAHNPQALDTLHSTLISQCRILENTAYPYLLHRAHEIAIVSMQEKDQVSQMVALELRKRGVSMTGLSHKQFLKNRPGRTRYRK